MGTAVIIILIITFLGFYFIPTGIANDRDHPQKTLIFLFNLLLGWTLIGWIICLFMALGDKGMNAKSNRKGARKCPQCAEWVKKEALICRFCQHDFRGSN